MKKYLIAGLLVWLPIWATVVMVKFVISMLDGIVDLLPHKYHPDTWLGISIPGIGLIVVLIFLFLTGILVTNYLGRKFITMWDDLIASIPFVRTIHGSVKQLTSAVFTENNQAFRRVLLVEYPRRGAWSIAFQTNDQIITSPNGERSINVYLPTTPNPTSGMLVIIPEADVHPFDISVEDAISMVISLGVITPKNIEELNWTKKP
jgi:uncharacterized membrane protein